MKFRLMNPYTYFSFGGLLLLAAMLYNTGLAFINAHGVPVGTLHVALSEAVIIAIALVYIVFKIRTFPNLMPPLLFLLFMISMFLYVSLLNEHLFPKAPRDMILIAVFFMIGGTVREESVIRTFRFTAMVVLGFMVIENYLTDLYVSLFEPAQYYANTRGIEELETDESGLFRNSLGYTGRFSFGFLSSHRLSSVFLEQVSLANFAMVLAIFSATFWQRIGRWDRVLFFATTLLIILTNNSRTASMVCVLILIGYYIWPLLPRYTHMLYMPFILLVSAVLFYDPHASIALTADDLRGRIGHTVFQLAHLGGSLFTGGSLDKIFRTMDSGYAYLIMTQTIFGMIAFWLFVSLIVKPVDSARKRFNHGTALYIFVNLLIGGAIFSVKVSAPLWFVAGYLYYSRYRHNETGSHAGA